MVSGAIDLLRKKGFSCTLPPKDYEYTGDSFGSDEEDVDFAALSVQEKEIAYLKEEYYSLITMEKGGETLVHLTNNCGWISIRCSNATVASIVDETIAQSPHFALGRVEHTKAKIDSEQLEVVQTTGDLESDGGGSRRRSASSLCSPGTLFELKLGDKVIAKALCSYKNSEMDNPGPTIELFEVAVQWRKHGHASTLLDAMTMYFTDVFADMESCARVKFNVCHVTSQQACRWFLLAGFQDWDGMGEELGMYLF